MGDDGDDLWPLSHLSQNGEGYRGRWIMIISAMVILIDINDDYDDDRSYVILHVYMIE